MLGSVSEAEDVAQEALLRLTRQEGPIDEPAAWMTTVVMRLSINVALGPASRAELADSLSLALLVLLERYLIEAGQATGLVEGRLAEQAPAGRETGRADGR
jgi:DNA-directed RNA polymerase specialized sigma24 family protein